MLSFIWSLAAFVFAFGILITVHEFGHFLVARYYGIKIERFSVGFGKTLWCRRDQHGTEYIVALIPFGGYVKMLDERIESVVPELRHQAFNNKTILQRAAVISAGPIANLLFALFIHWLIFIHGIPSIRPVIGEIISGSVAEEAQISPGMELKAIDDIETPGWDVVRMVLIGKIGDRDITLKLSSPFDSSQYVEKRINLQNWYFELDKQDPVLALGIVPFLPESETVLEDIQINSPASIAGLRPGDRVIKVNNQPLMTWQKFTDVIKKSSNRTIELNIERNGKIMSLVLTPIKKGTEGFAGIVLRTLPLPEKYKTILKYDPLTAITESVRKTWQLMRITIGMLSKLINGNVKLSSLSGPISIAQGAGISAEYGMMYYLMFLALISVNLSILNSFPLPVLDGGHLLFLVIESIKGKPVSKRVQDLSYYISSIFLLFLMGLSLFNDLSRL